MQVVKNDYMAGFERDGRYKVLQATYAVRLEKQKSKEEILERYLNTVFFGQNSYGIGAAAETYFGKPVQQLTFRSKRRSSPGWCRPRRTYDPIINPEQSRNALRPGPRSARVDAETPHPVPSASSRPRRPVRAARARPASARTRPPSGRTSPRRCATTCSTAPTSWATPTTSATRCLHRGGLTIHTTLDPGPAGPGRTRGATNCPDNLAGIDAALTSIDNRHGSHPGDGGRQGVRPRPARGQPGAGAEPDRFEHQDVHPCGGAPGRRPTGRPGRWSPPLYPAEPGRPERADVHDRRRRRRWRQHGPLPHRPLDQLRLRSHVADGRSQPHGRHRLPDVGQSLPVPGGSRRANERRSSRSARSPPAPTR